MIAVVVVVELPVNLSVPFCDLRLLVCCSGLESLYNAIVGKN